LVNGTGDGTRQRVPPSGEVESVDVVCDMWGPRATTRASKLLVKKIERPGDSTTRSNMRFRLLLPCSFDWHTQKTNTDPHTGLNA
jgi:hypothetical protein